MEKRKDIIHRTETQCLKDGEMEKRKDIIYPIFKENAVPILFAANDSFAPYMAVAIRSILDHATPDHNYDIVVLHKDISENTMKMMQSMTENYDNASIRFFDMNQFLGDYRFYTSVAGGRLTEETYFRLFAGEIFADGYERVVYLDGDMVVMTDIAQLYEVDLDGYYLAAARDMAGIAYCHKPLNDRLEYREKTLGLTEPDNYFIGSPLVMNLNMLRTDYPERKLIDIASSREWQQHDQDVLNVICNGGKAKLLHAAWSVLEDYGDNHYLPRPLKEEWRESVQDPKIIHYGGDRKPWLWDVPRQEYFWTAAARTPFFETIIARMVKADGNERGLEQFSADIENLRARLGLGTVLPLRTGILRALYDTRVERLEASSKMPLVSVIIPVYNTERYLEKCLLSVMYQTYSKLEIILVDDGSSDNSGALCDKYAALDPRIKVVHQKNGGVASARNTGLMAATGDYIGWVDSDDFIELDMFEYLVKGSAGYQADVTICGKVGWFPGFAGYLGYCEERFFDPEQGLKELISDTVLRNYLWDKLWRRDLFEGITFPGKQVCEDAAVLWRLFGRANKVVSLPQGKYHHLEREGSLITVNSLKNRWDMYSVGYERFVEMKGVWPRLELDLAFRCFYWAKDFVSAYYAAAKPEREQAKPWMDELSAQCGDYLTIVKERADMGRAGMLMLDLFPYNTPHNYRRAKWIKKLYKLMHKTELALRFKPSDA